jgi:hypothetical protein
MLRLRTHAWICFGFLLALLALGWGGALLAESGLLPAPPPAWKWTLLALLFALMLGFAFSAVPVMVLLVTGVQKRIGSPAAVLAQPRWQNAIVYVLWGLMAAGSAIAIPAAFLLGGFADFGVDPGASRGTLVARPGMSIAEVKRASTLPIDAPDDAPAIGEGVVFDFELAGTGIRLPRCRYYFASTHLHNPRRIEGMSIGASTSKATRAQVEAADAGLRRALAADGWLTGHEEYRTEQDRALHGGAERGPEGNIWLKGDIVLNIERKRMDEPRPGEDAAVAGEFIQVVSLWSRADYGSLERYVFAPPTPPL